MAVFTRENAAQFARRSVQARLRNNLAREEAAARAAEAERAAIEAANRAREAEAEAARKSAQAEDPYAQELMHAQEETLRELRAATTPKDRAACARALRELRETYHMVTGEPRPGIRRPEPAKRRGSGNASDGQARGPVSLRVMPSLGNAGAGQTRAS